MRRAFGWIAWIVGGSLAAVGTILLLVNLFVNLGLPRILNERPDRLSIHYSFAWTVVPGTVHVYGLRIRSQGKRDQWLLEADRARGEIDLAGLRERRFTATAIDGRGVTFRYRFRAPEGTPPDDALPSIPGLDRTQPDSSAPRGTPWAISLSNVTLTRVRELWLETYRLADLPQLRGGCTLGGDLVAASGVLVTHGGSLGFGMDPVAAGLTGEIRLDIDGLERNAGLGRAALANVSGSVALEAEVRSLRFLENYLDRVPWLSIDGQGKLSMNLGVDHGRFTDGSWLTAATDNLAVRFLSYDILGDGSVKLETTDEGGTPESRLTVAFGGYTIGEADHPPLVQGTGFTVVATSPDRSLSEPFTDAAIALTLPESHILNIEEYNAFLPQDVGFALRSGTGKVSGRLEASTADSVATGAMSVIGDDVRATFDDLSVTLNLALEAKLVSAQLDRGEYDFSGSRLELRQVGIVDRSPSGRGPDPDSSRSWWATVTVPEGKAMVGQPVYLDAQIALRSADSVPFVRVFAERKELAGWLQKALSIDDVVGGGRLKLGSDTVELSPFAVTAGNYEVRMRWYRQRRANRGSVFARYGKLSVGMRFDGDEREVHVFDARDWFTDGGHAR
ncbi:MAG: hypothetical protein ABMB14_08995 [Myxococcota bacterium]